MIFFTYFMIMEKFIIGYGKIRSSFKYTLSQPCVLLHIELNVYALSSKWILVATQSTGYLHSSPAPQELTYIHITYQYTRWVYVISSVTYWKPLNAGHKNIHCNRILNVLWKQKCALFHVIFIFLNEVDS